MHWTHVSNSNIIRRAGLGQHDNVDLVMMIVVSCYGGMWHRSNNGEGVFSSFHFVLFLIYSLYNIIIKLHNCKYEKHIRHEQDKTIHINTITVSIQKFQLYLITSNKRLHINYYDKYWDKFINQRNVWPCWDINLLKYWVRD